ncbi:hypothetical protein [Bacillus sp. ISL-45]|uniref:hypothetical protein n=1 Tax=Bacillus sp. ISL-45 TaxID=2819128 RepID=UPI001BE4EAAE|nr:hypothetical protein [Bacillus sp. ISL-45]MBT2663311.1 hypothetical protein [Bacillus sp. ISL-45]
MSNKIVLFYGVGVLQLFIGLGAVGSGIGFILEPNGSNLSMSGEFLKESPFEDYLIPGITLLTINGLGSIVGSFFSFRRHPLAGKITMILGCLMVIWIIAQVYWINWISFLQPLFLVLGNN